MTPVFSQVVLGKHNATYFSCEQCGLLQTETPYWLEEAYGTAISVLDTGLVSRNLCARTKLEPILHRIFPAGARFVDVGGGYGLLTRLLRDIGFDCYTQDKYCENIFAKTFEPSSVFRADALLAFEVLEHIENPIEFLRKCFADYGTKTILFSTSTFEGDIPARDWEYYVFESGQHITFYQPKTLKRMAAELGCQYYRIGKALHVITDRNISQTDLFLLSRRYVATLYRLYVKFRRRGKGKTIEDSSWIKKQLLEGSKEPRSRA